MKYLKKFENIKYKKGDIVSYFGIITIIDDIIPYFVHRNQEGYVVRNLNTSPIKLSKINKDGNLSHYIYASEYELSVASKKDIEDFKMKIQANKYNL